MTDGPGQIVNHINAALQSNPNECFILEGYSQGASATVNALPWITGAAFDAVKGVFLIGDPLHLSGLACNVDNYGGTTTRYVNGLEFGAQVPANWISKTLDVCIFVSDSKLCRSSDYPRFILTHDRAMVSATRGMVLESMRNTVCMAAIQTLRVWAPNS